MLGAELADRVADRAMAEMDEAGARLEAALAAPTPPRILPPWAPPPRVPPPSEPQAAAATMRREVCETGEAGGNRPAAEPAPVRARRRAARLGPAAWNVLFSLMVAEVRRLIALALEVEHARTTGRPLRPAAEPEHDPARFERVRTLAREAAAADPHMQDLLARVDALIDEAAESGLAGAAPADLAARICAELGIAFGPEGPEPQDRPEPGPDPP